MPLTRRPFDSSGDFSWRVSQCLKSHSVPWTVRHEAFTASGLREDDILEVCQWTGSGDLPPDILQLVAEAALKWTATVW